MTDQLHTVLMLLQQFKAREERKKQTHRGIYRYGQVELLDKMIRKLRKVEAQQEYEEMESARQQAGKLDNERIPR